MTPRGQERFLSREKYERENNNFYVILRYARKLLRGLRLYLQLHIA